MKNISLFLVITLIISLFSAIPAAAETTYTQAPMFDERVTSGEIPPVDERLPENPKLVHEVADQYLDLEVGTYGGTLRMVTNVVNWSADAFTCNNEHLLYSPSCVGDVYEANIVESYSINEDLTEFTFTLRKGLKWSDGEEVTVEDFAFAINDFVFNEELTPYVANFMRDGGSSTGDPFTFEVINDYEFKISFKKPYGGFLNHISINSWKGYTDLLKPAHYLKPFHIAYAEECHGSIEAYYEYIAPFAQILGYDDPTAEGVWVYVFNAIDMTNWETTDPNAFMVSTTTFAGLIDKNMPVLYAWIMVSSENGVITHERNPYFWKVDADGQQLPYIDYLNTKFVESMELVHLSAISGDVDFIRESASIDNISMYRENAEAAGITAYLTDHNTNPAPIRVNANYGMNDDGTIKDDEASQAWQEVIVLPEFKRALILAVDAEEIIDIVYQGQAIVNEYYDCIHDIDTANALLDEIGMVDIDGDGYRETPSGKQLSWMIWNNSSGTYWITISELVQEYWREIGLNVQVNTTDSSLMGTAESANEIPMSISFLAGATTWWVNDWQINTWAPLWNKWMKAGGMAGAELDPAEYLEPPQEVKDFILKVESLLVIDSETAQNEVYPQIHRDMAELGYLIVPILKTSACVVLNTDIGNVPSGGIAISWAFAAEQFYFKNLD